MQLQQGGYVAWVRGCCSAPPVERRTGLAVYEDGVVKGGLWGDDARGLGGFGFSDEGVDGITFGRSGLG